MKLWVNLAVERDTCNQDCDFRELCNQRGSIYVLESVIIPTSSTSFELVYYNCGASQLQIKKKEVLMLWLTEENTLDWLPCLQGRSIETEVFFKFS